MWMLRDFEHLLIIWLMSCLTLKKFDGGWSVRVLMNVGCVSMFWRSVGGYCSILEYIRP